MTIESEVNDVMEPIVRVLQTNIKTIIQGHLVRAYISADRELMTWGMTKGGIPIAYEGPPMEQAIKWAEKHSAKLVTQMDTETKSRLAKVVSEAIENKKGIPGLAKNIRNEFDSMTKYRSQMIAETETANALSEGSFQRMQSMGVDGKEWVRGSNFDCDICGPNADAGVIPLDQPFPSGDMRPPGHPKCLCALAPARLKKE
jgi:hypothetical protein